MNQQQVDHIEMSVPAKPEFVGVVRLTVSGIANRLGFTYDDIEDIKIAVAEACTNVVNHAYEDEGLISASFVLHEDRMEIVIADRGQSFDINGLRERLGPVDSTKPVGDLKEGGLGLFLINTLMDKVEINDESGVILMMTKFIRGDEVEKNVDGVPSTQTEQR
ncbi:anti-sigma B factor RsbW [Alkalihalophilus marmarensis]|jgi:serine/threonine-protein kinase RsbW|uniref:Serine-protein kinase RsbW n=1 Tax=Alkalihalophilus marmarensis DSM 21297 TaxID=1188261 RepID=U6SLM6_9BACI|nr:anti-sigma B factor RsbW [Alkalihalophilus marmarensis]ERN52629.1 serine-protein kinase [Alkalihalophilus marmarensis DSM 21297]MCM3491667.1 anti-sigma B factor RsbW [Alkalihalophilus marmarensis]